MKDTLLFVINNVAKKYNKDEFINRSFNSLHTCTNATYFNSKLIIVDDSGELLSDEEFEKYYEDIKGYPNVEIIRNKKNLNLLASRFVVLDTIDKANLKNTWIRFLDSGDIATSSSRFQMELMMKMNDTNADWYVFLQGKLDEYDMTRSYNSYYYSCYGDINNKLAISESILGKFLSSTVWTKVYRADLFAETMNEIKRLNGGTIPYLFHTEDYMINCIYAKYVSGLASLPSMFVMYDTVSGESYSRVVTSEYYDQVSKQLKIVYDTVKNAYNDYDLIPNNIIDYYIGKKINRYLDRFYCK